MGGPTLNVGIILWNGGLKLNTKQRKLGISIHLSLLPVREHDVISCLPYHHYDLFIMRNCTLYLWAKKTKQKNPSFSFPIWPLLLSNFFGYNTQKTNQDTPCVNESSWTYVFQPLLGLWMVTAEMSWLKRDLSQTKLSLNPSPTQIVWLSKFLSPVWSAQFRSHMLPTLKPAYTAHSISNLRH